MQKSILFSIVIGSLFFVDHVFADVALFLGNEYQAQAGTNAGTIRAGDPASDSAFGSFLGTASLTRSDVLIGDNCATAADGVYATWGAIGNGQSAINMGATTATASIAGWNDTSNSLGGASGNAVLAWSYNNSGSLQSGAPRPGFASGVGSGYGIRTNSGATSDGIRNAVRFDFSTPISAFGIYGGDLETGGPNSPEGFLFVHFTDGSTETINYSADSTLFADANFSGTGNNLSETYGNETGRFVGLADNTRLMDYAVFVVGDDDENDDADSEQLSFIAPISFTEVTGGACSNHVPTIPSVPEPGALFAILLGLALTSMKRRRAL